MISNDMATQNASCEEYLVTIYTLMITLKHRTFFLMKALHVSFKTAFTGENFLTDVTYALGIMLFGPVGAQCQCTCKKSDLRIYFNTYPLKMTKYMTQMYSSRNYLVFERVQYTKSIKFSFKKCYSIVHLEAFRCTHFSHHPFHYQNLLFYAK